MLKWTEIEKDPNLLINMSTLVFLKKKTVSFLTYVSVFFLHHNLTLSPPFLIQWKIKLFLL